jgi:hypothetical protein
MPAAQQAKGHVPAHLPETNHSDVHVVIPFVNADDRVAGFRSGVDPASIALRFSASKGPAAASRSASIGKAPVRVIAAVSSVSAI